MPELPEVESLKRSLEMYILGQKILKIEIGKPKLVSSKGTVRQPLESKKIEFIDQLTFETIDKIDRVAKNLVVSFKSGKILLIHLKMTGQLVYKSNDKFVSGGHPIQLSEVEIPNKHTHIIFTLENGNLYYNDTRMFGYLLYYPDISYLEKTEHFSDLGLDPFDPEFSLAYFTKKLKSNKSRLKSVFLSQKVVLGLGNIYADEVCFFAKTRPDRPCNTLNSTEIKNLYLWIVKILTNAITLGGSSVANYLLADGSRGNYAREHRVYNRAGMPCLECGSTLEKIKINSRTTVYCAFCQK